MRAAQCDVPDAIPDLSHTRNDGLGGRSTHRVAGVQLALYLAGQGVHNMLLGLANQSPINGADEAAREDRSLRLPVISLADNGK